MNRQVSRCAWAGNDPLYVAYHDEEWGVPVRDSRKLFEHIILDGMQAGLAWITILRKREGYRSAFAGFDPERMARFDDADMARLMQDARIVRNRQKINAAIGNARAFLRVEEGGASFAELLWDFVGGAPQVNRWRSIEELPAQSAESVAMSRELRRLGFRFVGPTICYAFMQASGLINDHLITCFRHAEVQLIH